MTYLQLINRVLTGLREGDNLVDTAATTIDDAYHLFIAELVNDFITEVERAHEWNALLQVVLYSHTANTAAVNIGLAANENNQHIRVMQRRDSNGNLAPLIYDYTDTTYPLYQMPLRQMRHEQSMRTSYVAEPTFISLEYEPSTQLCLGRLWGVPDNTRSIALNLIVPQARLDPTVHADLDTEIKVPANTVALGAIWYALAERGEELGVNPAIAQERYLKSLADEIAADVTQEGDERYDIELA